MPGLCLLKLYMLYQLIKYYNYARFMPTEPLYAIPTDQIPARSHQSAAIIHMLLNNLDPRLGKNVLPIFIIININVLIKIYYYSDLAKIEIKIVN